MKTCDQRDCPARGLREFTFDSGQSLWGCLHHSADWFAWIEPELRFLLEPMVIAT